MRLIDADELKKEVESAFHGALGITVTGAVHEIIDRQPTIDPESLRPKGHWESPSKLLNIVNCTACKTTFPVDFDEFRYCPCCGCFMENKDDVDMEES